MVRTIRAKFSRGVFEPLEPAAAEMVREGQEVLITISTESAALAGDPIRDTAGGWKDLSCRFQRPMMEPSPRTPPTT